VRLDPSPIPKGKLTANSNRAYLSPDTTVSISGHILFILRACDFFDLSCFNLSNQLCLIPTQSRHPERSASQIYWKQRLYGA
jgi:hypothetical protein